MSIKAQTSHFELCKMSTKACIFRKIWIARCRAHFDGVGKHTRSICLRILSKIQLYSHIVRPHYSSTIMQQNSLDILGINRRRTQSKFGTWCRWERPPEGWLKLNVDGSSRAESTSGGGIIRNHLGVVVVAFSNYYRLGTNKSVEIRALYDGLCLCQNLNATHVFVESDLLIVVTAVQNERVSHWALEYVFRRCIAGMGGEHQIYHVYRQKNIVADRLADYAHSYNSPIEWFDSSEFPTSIQNSYSSDLHGLWNFQK